MRRLRTNQNLYHQFIKGTDLDGKINTQDALKCLAVNGLIESYQNHYYETDKMKSLDGFPDCIVALLREWHDGKN